LEMLQQRPTGSVHHALWKSRRSGRVHHVHGMIERQSLEGGRPSDASQRIPPHCTRNRRGVHTIVEVWNDDDVGNRRNTSCDITHALEAVDLLSCVTVAVGADQNLGLDLTESVQYALNAEVRRARAPYRAECRRSEHRDDRFRQIRQKAGDAIAHSDTHVAQRGRDAAYLAAKLRKRQLMLSSRLIPRDDRRPVVSEPQEILGKVELRSVKPFRSELRIRRRHAIQPDALARIETVRDKAAEISDRTPEFFTIDD